MKLENFRDLTISIAAIIFSVAAITLVSYTIYGIYLLDYQAKGMIEQANHYGNQSQLDIMVQQESLSTNVFCGKSDEDSLATIMIQNSGSSEIKNIKCRITDKGGLASDAEQQIIGSLPPQSKDACTFTLKGYTKKPLRFLIEYGGKSIKDVCTI